MNPPIGEASGQVDMFVRSLGQADHWSDVPNSPISEVSVEVDMFVRSLGQTDLWSDVPPWMRLQIRLTFCHTLGQADFCEMYPLGEAFGQVDICHTLGQADFCEMYPLGEAFGQVDICHIFRID